MSILSDHRQHHLDAMKIDNVKRINGADKTLITEEIAAAEIAWPNAFLRPFEIHDSIEIPILRLNKL